MLQDWGLIDFRQAWDRQSELLQQLIEIKRGRLVKDSVPAGYFVLCEHNPVYTLGKSGKNEHLKLNSEALDHQKISFYKINRGGDITFHGPGQVVGYPILDLDQFFTDVHKYIRLLEEVVIRTLADFNLIATRLDDYTGVWLAPDRLHEKYRKICAIGVHLSRWVSMHGFALNVNTDLEYFKNIVPCGIKDADKEVTSIEKEIGMQIDSIVVKAKLRDHFSRLFEAEIIEEKNTNRE